MDIIETERLVLRKAKLTDATDLLENFWSQESQAKYMLWTPTTTYEDAVERTQRTIEFQKKYFAFVICEKKSNKPIGLVGFNHLGDGVYDDCGFGMGSQFVGKGYGSEILNKLVEVLFEKMGAKKIICSAFEENYASIRMQEKCGFKFVKKDSGIRKRDGLNYTLVVNEITREDYEKRKCN